MTMIELLTCDEVISELGIETVIGLPVLLLAITKLLYVKDSRSTYSENVSTSDLLERLRPKEVRVGGLVSGVTLVARRAAVVALLFTLLPPLPLTSVIAVESIAR